MAEEITDGSGSFVVKNIQNVHHLKIDVVKFKGTNNFSLWRCEVLDALNIQILKDTLKLQEQLDDIVEKDWKKMNQTTCGVMRSCLT